MGVGFPDGHAATQRVRNYTNMLRELGYDCEVLCADPSCRDASVCPDIESRGVSDGVPFRYTGGFAVRSPHFAVRRLRAAKSWLRIVVDVVSGRPDLVLAYPMTTPVALLLLPAVRLGKSVLICDQSELPAVHAGAGIRGKVRLFWRWFGLRRVDGVIAITPAIQADLGSRLDNGRILHLPVIIDSAAGDELRTTIDSASPEIVYTGRLNEAKDGSETLISAFALVATRRTDVRLVLAGESSQAAIASYKELAETSGVSGRVDFMGMLDRPDLQNLMARAAVLVLPRPDTAQNRANMPTKLIEYLATGRPVVATNVGTVTKFLMDGRDAFLSEPSDPASLSAAIFRVLDDPAGAASIAEQGRTLAVANWDYRSHTVTFGDFIRHVSAERGLR